MENIKRTQPIPRFNRGIQFAQITKKSTRLNEQKEYYNFLSSCMDIDISGQWISADN